MPPQHLFPLAIHCLSQQLHVFIEKPPGVTLHQTKEMALAAEKNDCKTMVGFNRRFIPLLQKVKTIVEARGPIIQCMSTFHKNTPECPLLRWRDRRFNMRCDSRRGCTSMARWW